MGGVALEVEPADFVCSSLLSFHRWTVDPPSVTQAVGEEVADGRCDHAADDTQGELTRRCLYPYGLTHLSVQLLEKSGYRARSGHRLVADAPGAAGGTRIP